MKKINIIIIVLLCSSLWQLSSASWVYAKAIIAQQLLNHSWELTLKDSAFNKHKPWSWADTWPVAKLSVPKHHIEQIVLAGDGGNSLAFGPGYSLASAMPNTTGTTVISAHRDTHFTFLKNIKIDEILHLQTVDQTESYRIYDLQIIDSKDYSISNNHDHNRLILVTCYPFEAFSSGGSLRYLVFAEQTSLNEPPELPI
jgi:sortase A